MKPSLSNCDEVPEVNTRLTKLHIPSAELSTLQHHLNAQGFKTTYKRDEKKVFLCLKSLWNVSHLLELQLWFKPRAETRRQRYFWVPGITPKLLCALPATPWQWLCVTADIMWFLLSPGSEADDGDFWALLFSPATAMTERKNAWAWWSVAFFTRLEDPSVYALLPMLHWQRN